MASSDISQGSLGLLCWECMQWVWVGTEDQLGGYCNHPCLDKCGVHGGERSQQNLDMILVEEKQGFLKKHI